MNKIVLSSIVAVAGIAASAQAQNGYQFEMRLIADGMAGAPTSGAFPNNFTAFNIGDVNNVQVSRIGFWLQARVGQTVNQNWGVVRATSPSGGTSASFITVTDPTGGSAMSRGHVGQTGLSAPGTAAFGRALGYRNGGSATGNTGNSGTSVPFPGSTGNLNGGLDNGGGGVVTTRVFAFDSYVGSTRPGSGDASDNPWGVNGGLPSAPVPSDGTMSPWASLYRIYIDVSNLNQVRDVVLNASALLNGAIGANPTDDSFASWAMQLAVNQGQVVGTSFTFHVAPTPGAAAMLGLGGLAAMRRRR